MGGKMRNCKLKNKRLLTTKNINIQALGLLEDSLQINKDLVALLKEKRISKEFFLKIFNLVMWFINEIFKQLRYNQSAVRH